MERRGIGQTDLQVAPICFGGNVFGWTVDQPTAFGILDTYLAGGGNFIDSADVYTRGATNYSGGTNVGGESETVLGNWFSQRKNREQVILATKMGNPMSDDPAMRGLSRRWIMQAVEGSLRRLQTDYIDIYQIHRDDLVTPQEETLRAMDDLIKAGKVRYIGGSNYSAWRFTRMLWTAEKQQLPGFVTMQPRYNLVDRAVYEREIEPMCVEFGIGVIPYYSLAAGFLSGKYTRDGSLPATPRAQRIVQWYQNERSYAIIDEVRKVATELQTTPAQVSLAWLMARPSVTAPIASATSVEQTEELLGATRLHLNAEQMERLNAVSAWSD